jgi:hypothetical protein
MHQVAATAVGSFFFNVFMSLVASANMVKAQRAAQMVASEDLQVPGLVFDVCSFVFGVYVHVL